MLQRQRRVKVHELPLRDAVPRAFLRANFPEQRFFLRAAGDVVSFQIQAARL